METNNHEKESATSKNISNTHLRFQILELLRNVIYT